MNVTLISDLLVPPLSGVGRYGYELAASLNLCERLTSLSFMSYRGRETWTQIDQRIKGSRFKQPSPEWSWAQIRSRIANSRVGSLSYSAISRAQYARIDASVAHALLHAPTLQALGSRLALPTVVTVHDLSHRLDAAWHPTERVNRLNTALRTLARADAVIAVSHSTGRMLIEQNWAAASAVHVVHNGVSPIFALASLGQLPSARRQTICVGTIEPRKNIETLLRAYAALPSRVLRDHPLLLVGEYGWRSASLHGLIAEMQSRGWLRYIGHVSDARLAREYRRARLCVYPSLHEGFGLPVLEAMAAGTPVIAGNHSSIPEVAGRHATLLADVTNVDEIREAILAELDSPWHPDAAAERTAHAARFSWAQTAAQTADVYERVLRAR